MKQTLEKTVTKRLQLRNKFLKGKIKESHKRGYKAPVLILCVKPNQGGLFRGFFFSSVFRFWKIKGYF